MQKKTVCLVTGGAGFIGSHVVRGLLEKGYFVRVLDDLSTGKLSNLPLADKNVKFYKGDLRKPKDVDRAVKGVKYVFHLGAIRAVLRSVDNPTETHDVNATGTLNILVAACRFKVARVIYTSTSAVYGDTKKFPTIENDLPYPESPYAVSKLMGEYYCKLYFKLYGLSTVSLRYFNVFGPNQNPESKYSAVIPIFIESLMKGRSTQIHWDGKQSRDFNYVDNIVHGNLLAMRAGKNVSGEIFNIACEEELSVLDIYNELKKLVPGKHKKPHCTPKRKGDVRRTLADISKSKKMLGFKVQTRFSEGLSKSVDWFLREHKK